MQVTGLFEVKMTAEAPYSDVDGISLGRVVLDKTYAGELTATSQGVMIGARNANQPTSAGYVAIERVTGSLAGRSGTFVLQHSGTMTRGAPHLDVTIVPDSGTGELAGLSGRMKIDIIDKKHHYTLDYELAP